MKWEKDMKWEVKIEGSWCPVLIDETAASFCVNGFPVRLVHPSEIRDRRARHEASRQARQAAKTRQAKQATHVNLAELPY